MKRSRAVRRRVKLPRQLRSPFLLGFSAALFIRLLYMLEISASLLVRLPVGDAKAYHEWGLAIAGGDWLGHGVFYQAPLYPYFLGVMHALFGPSLWPARIVQALIGAIGVGAAAESGAHFFGRRAGVITGLMLAFYPALVFYDGLIQKTVLDVALFSVFLLALLRYDGRRTRARGLLAGLALGVLCLSRENALALLVAVVPWLLLRDAPLSFARLHASARRPLGWKPAAVFLAGFLLAVAPVTLRNVIVGGDFALTTSQLGPNLWIGNNPEADGRYRPLIAGRGDARFERDDARTLAEKAEGKSLSPAGVSAHWTKAALSYIAHRPASWLVLLVKKARLSLSAGEVCDTDAIEAYADHSVLLGLMGWVWNFATLFALATLGLVLTWSRRSRWVLGAMLGVLWLSLIAFFVAGRYRAPLVPLLAIFAGTAAARVIDWVRFALGVSERGGLLQTRRHNVALIASMLALTFALIPFPYHRAQRALNYYAVGSAFLEAGRNLEAEDAFGFAIDAYPRYAPAHRKLGIVLYRGRQMPAALRQLDLAIEMDPSSAENRLVRAMLLEELGREDDALSDYDEALRLEPANAEARSARDRLRGSGP